MRAAVFCECNHDKVLKRWEAAPAMTHAEKAIRVLRKIALSECFCPFQNNCNLELSIAVQAQITRTIFFMRTKLAPVHMG
jgi:hypothetical protein